MIFSLAGLGVLAVRLVPVIRGRASSVSVGDADALAGDAEALVSIIVPARNEEANLPKILESLVRLDYPNFEVIVVDDNSEDRTGEIIEQFAARDGRVRAVKGTPRPEGWTGKNWACRRGFEEARGEWLLFTDADTEHRPASLKRMIALDADLCSAVPYHETNGFLESLLGPFHILVFLSSSAFGRPRPRALFAIGQYLLFRREQYVRQGQHEAVRMSFSDDLDLAEQCLAHGGRYALDTSGEIFKVRMYADAAAFFAGWKRIFRIGFAHARVFRAIEIFLVIACLMTSFHAPNTPELACAAGGIALLALAERRYGAFSPLGAVLAPIGVFTFIAVSAAALFDRITGRDLRWRGRSYKVGP